MPLGCKICLSTDFDTTGMQNLSAEYMDFDTTGM